MKSKVAKLARQFIMNAETPEALQALLNYAENRNNKDRTNEVILLFSDFNELVKKARKGLGEYNEEKNRINLAILAICNEIEEDKDDEDPKIPVSSDVLFSGMTQKLDQLEAQLQMIHRQLERLLDDGMDRFQHSTIWKYLEKKTKDHLLAAIAMERDEYLENYSVVILELCNALEHELKHKIFIPYKVAYNAETPNIDREVFMNNNDGQLKNILYDYLVKEDVDITLNQMVGILFDSLLAREKEKGRKEPFLHILRFIYRQIRIMNLHRLMECLERLNGLKYERIAKSFISSKEESDELKKMTLDIFQSLQPIDIK